MDHFYKFIKSKKVVNTKELNIFLNENSYILLSLNDLENVAKLLRLTQNKIKNKESNYYTIIFDIKSLRKYTDILNINDYNVIIYNNNSSNYEIVRKYESKSLIEIYFDYQTEFEKKYE